jgi:hypothetical protein
MAGVRSPAMTLSSPLCAAQTRIRHSPIMRMALEPKPLPEILIIEVRTL